MFRVSGKQEYGAVYRDGRPIVTFHKGVGYAGSADDADYLKSLGYTVESGKPAPADAPTGRTASKKGR